MAKNYKMKYLSLVLILMMALSYHVAAQTNINYQSSSDDFANPERGFYRYSETRSSNYSLLDQSTLENYRLLHSPPSANYSIYSTLVFRYFFLEDFKQSNISQAYLDNMLTDFNTARLAGVKLIPRFAYTDEVDGSGCSSWICPPYGDAAKSWVLTHIAQLAPLLETNKDVIAAVQMGLVGVWGENYYTDYFGDASQGPDYKLLDANWTDRIDVLNDLLDAVPVERMVQVRYPQQKQRAVYGINAPTNSAALTLSEAFLGTDKARLGFHNDCILASADDFGTYTDYGNSSSSSNSDTTNLKPYFAADSRFVVVGGETCGDAYNPQNNCASTDPAAYGDTELERMHYSYLNAQFNNDVNNDWEDDGCMDAIKKRLGYRLELQDGMFSNSAQPDQVIDLAINLKNVGYASTFNERAVEIILRNTSTSDSWYAALSDDPRFWFAGEAAHSIAETLCIPSDLPIGTYEVLLNLPDPMPSLYALPEYSIRLANLLPDNSDLWEPTTGYNKLGHSITIDNSSSNSTCNGEITFTPTSTILPVDLVHFSAKSKDEHIVVEWTTASEFNVDGFIVERSLNGKDFNQIASKDGKGELGVLSNYAIIDSEIKNNTTYYYRLLQKDLDGTIEYSNTVNAKVGFGNEWTDFVNSITIYPNPTHSEVTINWNNDKLDVIEVQLINVLGAQVLNLGLNTKVINMVDLPKGIYFIKLRTEDKEVVRKIVRY